jgi:hypothetical protein
VNKPEEEKKTQSQILTELAADCEMFHTPENDCYAVISVDGHSENWRVRSQGFRRWLTRQFYWETGKPPGGQALSDALNVLEARAQFEGEEHSVHIRVEGHADEIYIDLCNDNWEVVKISTDGWTIINESPIKFIRAKGMLPLPSPEPGGSLILLRQFMNLQDETSWKLVVGALVASLRGRGPYPILVVQGEQGSAKSTLGRIIRSLIDPSSAPLRTKPREERDLMIAARNGWILGFDNLSGIPNWLSDALCRLSTGGGFSTRQLYTDAEEVIFDAQRPCMVNGIDDLAVRDDFRDRAIIVNLPTIPEEKRQDENTFWQEFEQARPKILGALLEVVSKAILNLPSIQLKNLPRMADFAKWIASAEPALEWEKGSFLEAYYGNREAAVEIGIEASPIAQAIIALREPMESDWEGTITELLDELEEYVPVKILGIKAWPKNAQALSNKLRRLAPSLRTVGYPMEFDIREGHSRKRKLRIEKDAEKSVRTVRKDDNGNNHFIEDDADDDLLIFPKSQDEIWETSV